MKAKIIKILLAAALLIALIFTLYRYFYGTWNIFGYPDRIQCFGRRYYKSNQTLNFHLMIPAGTELPHYPVYSLNLLIGKKLYTSHPNGKYVPSVIYLYVGNSAYVLYSLSGGP